MITAHIMSGSRQELMDLLNIRSEILFNLFLVFTIMFLLFSYLFYQFSLSEFWFSNISRKLFESSPVAQFTSKTLRRAVFCNNKHAIPQNMHNRQKRFRFAFAIFRNKAKKANFLYSFFL